ncbi:Ribosome biogenesis regulatory [Glycine soja]
MEGTHLVQAIADALFILPSTEDLDGTLVTLPPSLTKLLREKHDIIRNPKMNNIKPAIFNIILAPIFAEEALEGRRETVRLYSVDQVLVVCKEDDKLPSSPRKALFEGVGNQ